jgi:hypothetical protein
MERPFLFAPYFRFRSSSTEIQCLFGPENEEIGNCSSGQVSGVEVWRVELRTAYLLPTLSSVGASRALMAGPRYVIDVKVGQNFGGGHVE